MDSNDLIKRSIIEPKSSKLVTENLSVTPIDTMVAGMEKPFSAHSDYTSTPFAHARTEQTMTQWPSNLHPADISLSLHQYPLSVARSMPVIDQTTRKRSYADIQFAGQQHEIIAPSQSPVVPQKKRRVEISSAPYTKAQQQQSNAQEKQRALTKLSQALSDEMQDSSGQVDLEQLLVRILAGPEDDDEDDEARVLPSGRTNKAFVSKSEAIKAVQRLSSIIKQSPGSAYTQPRKGVQGFNTNSILCPHCPIAVTRPCDMKKHMKRHEKPYGCTYPKCHKRFGAKSDWKRHEHSQHFQLEAFRCSLPSPSPTTTTTTTTEECGAFFIRPENFKQHLSSLHKIFSQDSINEHISKRRIGKNCQHAFWCGFEKKIVPLVEKRNAAWDERFDHIAKHFEKDGRSIDEWICVEENRTKKELLKELDKYVFDDEEDLKRKRAAAKQVHISAPGAPVQLGDEELSATLANQTWVEEDAGDVLRDGQTVGSVIVKTVPVAFRCRHRVCAVGITSAWAVS
ncbi:hypothetical protein ACEQ8H_005830 [Pleosporales sp. CAS-2024a]